MIEETYGSASWPATHYSKFIDDFKAHGDELGLHPHAYRWDECDQTWITDHGNQDWVEHCVNMAFAAYSESLEQGCVTFRFGDHWMNDQTSALIEKLGVRFDLTLEPGYIGVPSVDPTMPYAGAIPDYYDAPRLPYRPSKTDFRKPGNSDERKLWIIPMSSGNVEGRLRAYRRLISRGVHPDRDHRPLHRTLNMKSVPAQIACRVMERLLNRLERPYLALVVGPSVALNPQTMRNMADILDYLLSHQLARRFVFSTPGEALKLLGYIE